MNKASNQKQKSNNNPFKFMDIMKPASPIQGYSIPRAPDEIFYLYGGIEAEEDYVDMIHTIRYATAEQEIMIHINSPGGNLNVCLAVINAIKQTQATVYTVVDGEAASAAAMIWAAGHVRMLASPLVILMFHTAATSFFGSKLPEIQGGVDIITTVIEELLDDVASDLLTEEERGDIRKGVDIFFLGSELLERLKEQEENSETEEVKS